jgi:hypothetical protein
VGLFDVMFGRKRLKEPADDRLFALATAQVTLDIELGLKPGGAAAVCFKPLSAGEFARADSELAELLEAVAGDTGTTVRRESDELGYQWIVFEDPDLEDLVTAIHTVASELKAKGFGDRLLAAMFRFVSGERKIYLIYGFKTGSFWPFVLSGEERKRDNAEELALKAKLEKELPIEDDLSKWLALYGAPI